MRLALLFGTCVVATATLAVGPTSAAPRVTEEVKYYEIGGRSGSALLGDMNKRGPRHGLLTRAIAQASYTTNLRGDLVNKGGTCRVSGAGVDLKITYTYPKPNTALKGELARRWLEFRANTIRHEEMHGKIARDMALELDVRLRGFAMADRGDCARAHAALKRDIDAIFARGEQQQKAFDAAEHRDGGPVEKSIVRLVGKR